jgi:uncharacterized protein YbaR (Trm112 family)
MHIQLTDILTCPVCGPAFGLIVRADRIVERRVREGVLGCPNCRRQYPIVDGVARLAANGQDATADAIEQPPMRPDMSDPDEAVRIAALLGLGQEAGRPSGFVALVGRAAGRARAVAALVEGQEFVAVDANAAGLDDSDRVSRVATDAALPFYDAKLRAIWLGGDASDMLLEDATRALHPLGRLVLEPSPADAHARLAARGLHVLAHERETLVATRS